MMRNLHRWISTTAMIFLAWVAVTGVVLALDGMFPPAGLGPREEEAPRATAAADAPAFDYDRVVPPLARNDIEARFSDALAAGLSAAPTAPGSVEIEWHGGRAEATARLTAPRAAPPPAQAAPAETAGPTPWYDDVPTRLRLHELIQDLHRGSIIGIGGQLFDILTGLSFMVLGITGIVMYLRMLERRRATGRPRFFWR